MNKSIALVLATAIVSGFSIYINSFAAKGLNPFLLTTLKNTLVAAMLLCMLFLSKKGLKKIFEPRLLPKFLAIGLIGGSLPFFLFFYALSQLSPAEAGFAGFIHKTLFIWASIFAFVFLKEKLSKGFIFASALLLIGLYIFAPAKPSFNFPLLLLLTATILWAAENLIAKKVLAENGISGLEVAFARMFYGCAFMLFAMAFFMPNTLLATFSLNLEQIAWLLITSFLLLLYVSTYYSGLKSLELHKAASILVLAQPITMLLSLLAGNTIGITTVLGSFLIVSGISILFSHSLLISKIRWKVPSWMKQKS